MAYFDQFSTITYNGTTAKNLVTRVRLQATANSYLQYALPDGTRADALASKYYNDPYDDWLIYFANDVIDPYYDVYLTDEQIALVMNQNYGSVAIAQNTIAYFKNNYATDDSTLTPAVWQALSDDVKPLYDYVLDYNRNIVGYKRAAMDVQMNTNVFIQMNTGSVLTCNTDDVFELLDSSNTHLGYAQVTSNVDDILTLYRAVGNTTGIANIRPFNSSVSIPVTLVQVTQVIPTDLQIYYSPVSVYDDYIQKNEARRVINLVPASQAASLNSTLGQILNG